MGDRRRLVLHQRRGPQRRLRNSTGDELKLKVPLFGYSLDRRAKKFGLEARAVWAQFFMPKAGDIVRAYREDGSPWFPNELYSTQAAVPDGYRPNRFFNVQELTVGASYRPIPNLVFEFDVQLRDRKRGFDELQINGGTG